MKLTYILIPFYSSMGYCWISRCGRRAHAKTTRGSISLSVATYFVQTNTSRSLSLQDICQQAMYAFPLSSNCSWFFQSYIYTQSSLSFTQYLLLFLRYNEYVVLLALSNSRGIGSDDICTIFQLPFLRYSETLFLGKV